LASNDTNPDGAALVQATSCAVLVLEDAVVVKTVMHHFEIQEPP